jgi:3-deoxy-D-manno-octulosonic-acid transferase
MKWWLYNAVFAVGFVVMLPRFLWRMWRRGGYGNGFLQRVARYGGRRAGTARPVWIHAVSVGETYVALRLMAALRRHAPDLVFVLTVNTSTGQRVAAERLDARDTLLYPPVDFPVIVRRALAWIDPVALILVEAEIWPNLVRLTHARGAPVLLVNGRLSAASTRGYRAMRRIFGGIFGSLELALMQSEADRSRVLSLGAQPERTHTAGSVKYDIACADAAGRETAQALLRAAGFRDGDPILVAGSTWPGEESLLAGVLRRLRARHRRLRLVLVPRHAERRAAVEADLAREGVSCLRRSTLGEGAHPRTDSVPPDVLLVDTTGELAGFYACADVVFVGKSLTRHGGQNPIEPAALGRAVIVGPNMENFSEITAELTAARALLHVRDAAGLERAVDVLLGNRVLRDAYGARAVEAVTARRGAVERSAERIAALLRGAVPEHVARP